MAEDDRIYPCVQCERENVCRPGYRGQTTWLRCRECRAAGWPASLGYPVDDGPPVTAVPTLPPKLPKPAAEIDAEKATKPRPDLVSPHFVAAAGRAMGYGAAKHGTGKTGRGTFRDPGEQSFVMTHVASFERHWNAVRRLGFGAIDPESGLREFDCACAQLSILADLIDDPPVFGNDSAGAP